MFCTFLHHWNKRQICKGVIVASVNKKAKYVKSSEYVFSLTCLSLAGAVWSYSQLSLEFAKRADNNVQGSQTGLTFPQHSVTNRKLVNIDHLKKWLIFFLTLFFHSPDLSSPYFGITLANVHNMSLTENAGLVGAIRAKDPKMRAVQASCSL